MVIICQDIQNGLTSKEKKKKTDAVKGRSFTKIGRELAVAIKEGRT